MRRKILRWVRGALGRTPAAHKIVESPKSAGGAAVEQLSTTLGLGTEGPLVTIVVPFFRDEKYIRWTLESVAAQSYANWECILIDDCGGDGSQSIAREFVTKDERFRIIGHEMNAGLASARNTGLHAARGEYLQFLDADDMLHTDAIEKRLLALMEFGQPHVAGAYCHVITKSASYSQIKASDPKKDMRVVDFITAAGDCPFACHCPLISVDVVRQFGGFNEELKQAEDYDLWMRILRHGYCFVPSMSTSGIYRMKPSGSMAVQGSQAHLDAAIQIFESAHRDLDRSREVAGTPFVYRKPWAYYANAVRKSSRVLQFAAMTDDQRRAGDIIEAYLPEDTMYAISRHVRAANLATDGIKRTVGIRGSEAPGHIVDYFTNDLWVIDRSGQTTRNLTNSDPLASS